MSADPRAVRMAIGQASMDMADAIDEETLKHVEEMLLVMRPYAEHLREKGLPPIQVALFLIGGVLGLVWEDR